MKLPKKLTAGFLVAAITSAARAFYEFVLVGFVVAVVGGVMAIGLCKMTRLNARNDNPPPGVPSHRLQVGQYYATVNGNDVYISPYQYTVIYDNGVQPPPPPPSQYQAQPQEAVALINSPFSFGVQFALWYGSSNPWLTCNTNAAPNLSGVWFGSSLGKSPSGTGVNANWYWGVQPTSVQNVAVGNASTTSFYMGANGQLIQFSVSPDGVGGYTTLPVATIDSDTNLYCFVLERATNSFNFKPVFTNYASRYDIQTWVDASPPAGSVFYRVGITQSN